MRPKTYDLVVPIQDANGRTFWHEVGVLFEGAPDSREFAKIRLNSLPLGAQAPLDIWVYPREEDKTQEGNKEQDSRPSAAGRRALRAIGYESPSHPECSICRRRHGTEVVHHSE